MSQKGSRCNPNPNPVHKELSNVTYWDCDTEGMVHTGLVTYRTLWQIRHVKHKGWSPTKNIVTIAIRLYHCGFNGAVSTAQHGGESESVWDCNCGKRALSAQHFNHYFHVACHNWPCPWEGPALVPIDSLRLQLVECWIDHRDRRSIFGGRVALV